MTRRSNRWLWLPNVLLAVAAGYVWGLTAAGPGPLHVSFLDVGQGDAAIIETPGGKCLAVDTGRASGGSSRGLSTVLPFLRSRGANRLDALILTHWDSDHAGGAPAVLSGMPVAELLLPRDGPWERGPTETERTTLRTASNRRTRVVHLDERNVLLTGDGVRLEVLNPPSEGDRFPPRSDNDASVVLLVQYRAARILLAADAEAEAEHRIVRSGRDVRADVLKVSHHGSASGTSDRWLNAVRPRLAVVSVGRHNPFGHPDPRVLARLERRGIRVLRTDIVGTVTVASDGSSYRVRTQRQLSGKESRP